MMFLVFLWLLYILVLLKYYPTQRGVMNFVTIRKVFIDTIHIRTTITNVVMTYENGVHVSITLKFVLIVLLSGIENPLF